MQKNKTTTAINILGLAVGISASLVIFLMVQYEYSFDKWEPQANNIYEVTSKYPNFYSPAIPIPAVEVIKNQITGIEATGYYLDFPAFDFSVTISSGKKDKDKIFNNEKGVVFADESYFNIFPHEWLSGNASTSLSQPNEVVLSLSVAKKYFPGISLDKVLGKRILFGDSTNAV
ncbi:MAG: ABC transporter permease, partial [Chitinophagaceae bacterium]